MSLIFAGTLSLRAIASLSETALPITLRFAPHDRQNFKSVEDSMPHWGQNITGTSRVISSRFSARSKTEINYAFRRRVVLGNEQKENAASFLTASPFV